MTKATSHVIATSSSLNWSFAHGTEVDVALIFYSLHEDFLQILLASEAGMVVVFAVDADFIRADRALQIFDSLSIFRCYHCALTVWSSAVSQIWVQIVYSASAPLMQLIYQFWLIFFK